ncbi:hypothetical protein ACOSQ2_021151 [Xanthoceras sorbifolium]
MDFFTRICILSLLSVISIQLISNVHADPNTFNVQDYGAVGDQKTDDSWAFLKAWNATCSATTGTATMIIPKGKTFLVYPITFWGPCKSTTVYVTLSGTVKAPEDPSAWKDHDVGKWLEFQGINGLNIDGYGQLDGSGQKWWDQSCKLNPGKEFQPCKFCSSSVYSFTTCFSFSIPSVDQQPNLVSLQQQSSIIRTAIACIQALHALLVHLLQRPMLFMFTAKLMHTSTMLLASKPRKKLTAPKI